MIAVIADDLSGAAEIAGAALRRGLSAEVQTTFDARAKADVICVDTDSRSMVAGDAGTAAAFAARRMREAGAGWIYKKCDSVLRGNVLAELVAVKEALGFARAVLVPANPSRGRVVRGGNLFVNGKPLHESHFAGDPDHPRTTSDLRAMLGSQPEWVSTPDAASEADLASHAVSVVAGTLAAGGVDFFEAMLGRLGFASAGSRAGDGTADRLSRVGAAGVSRALTMVVCGSAASWGKRRRLAAERGIPTFRLVHGAAEIAGAFGANRCILVGIGDEDAAPGVFRPTLLGSLSRTCADVLRLVPVGHVMLEGGATASAFVRELGWSRLVACDTAAPSICTFRSIGEGIPAVSIKPGSYDWPANLWP
jgi:D-threonate/D-erythronate kinase